MSALRNVVVPLTMLVIGSALALAPAVAPIEPARGAATDPVVAAVGDMACDPADPTFNNGWGTSSRCAERRTSDAMASDTSLQAVLGLGDYQYDCGDASDYAVSYTPTWGRLDDLMQPVPGNHEYKTGKDAFGSPCPTDNDRAAGYFGYFGAAAHPRTVGHFSFDLGSWHVVALNANCSKSGVGGCGARSAQTTWLKADLASTTKSCILSFWHQPLWSGTGTGRLRVYRPWWDVLRAAHADVVLNGHIHNYQRFAALDPDGTADPANGITEYVVGTGGEQRVSVKRTARPQPMFWARTFGYLRMTLQPDGWKAEFVDYRGVVLDSSRGACHAP